MCTYVLGLCNSMVITILQACDWLTCNSKALDHENERVACVSTGMDKSDMNNSELTGDSTVSAHRLFMPSYR